MRMFTTHRKYLAAFVALSTLLALPMVASAGGVTFVGRSGVGFSVVIRSGRRYGYCPPTRYVYRPRVRYRYGRHPYYKYYSRRSARPRYRSWSRRQYRSKRHHGRYERKHDGHSFRRDRGDSDRKPDFSKHYHRYNSNNFRGSSRHWPGNQHGDWTRVH